jgi:hypothetical protein
MAGRCRVRHRRGGRGALARGGVRLSSRAGSPGGRARLTISDEVPGSCPGRPTNHPAAQDHRRPITVACSSQLALRHPRGVDLSRADQCGYAWAVGGWPAGRCPATPGSTDATPWPATAPASHMVVSSVPANRSDSQRGMGNRRGGLPVTSRQMARHASMPSWAMARAFLRSGLLVRARTDQWSCSGRRVTAPPRRPVAPATAMIRASCCAIAVVFSSQDKLESRDRSGVRHASLLLPASGSGSRCAHAVWCSSLDRVLCR